MWAYSLVPGPPEQPAPLPYALFGLACAAGLLLYARHIVVGPRHEERATQVTFDGPFPIAGIEVNAPWHAGRVPDRLLPLVLDGQGTFHAPRRGCIPGRGVRR